MTACEGQGPVKRTLAKMRHGVVAALDVGTTKTCCYIARVGEPHPDGGTFSGVQIIGIGHQVTNGMRNGTIVDIDAVEAAIRRSVDNAEKMARHTVERVYVSLAGGRPESHLFAVELAIDGRSVTDSDLRRIMTYGRSTEVEQDRSLVHVMPVRFTIDGTGGIRDPRGLTGKTFGVRIHRVTAGSGSIQNLHAVVERCHLEVERYVISPYASGLSCLVEDEMDLGVTVIDMGGGTTSVAVFYGGGVIFTDIVPVGGDHVTSDIARGLSTSLADAERLKTLHGCARLSPTDDIEIINVPQVGEGAASLPNQVQKAMLIRIIQPRLEETFELVRDRLKRSGLENSSGQRVVLTGGASQLPGIPDLAHRIFGKQIRPGRPVRFKGLPDATSGPSFSTCAGLLAYAVDPGFDRLGVDRMDTAAWGGWLGRLMTWIKENA